jgi:hypothetical protein
MVAPPPRRFGSIRILLEALMNLVVMLLAAFVAYGCWLAPSRDSSRHSVRRPARPRFEFDGLPMLTGTSVTEEVPSATTEIYTHVSAARQRCIVPAAGELGDLRGAYATRRRRRSLTLPGLPEHHAVVAFTVVARKG